MYFASRLWYLFRWDDGTGFVVDNDTDGDGVCNDDEIAGCQDATACNYNASATDDDASCIYTVDPCDTCSGDTDGTGVVVDNDTDGDLCVNQLAEPGRQAESAY